MKWSVSDMVPTTEVDAIFCFTYSLNRSLTRLTNMCEASFAKGLDLMENNESNFFVVSTAQPGGKIEKHIKLRMIKHLGINLKKVVIIKNTHDTYDETMQVVKFLRQINGKSLIVIADRNHMKRALYAFKLLAPDVSLYHISTTCRRYEIPYYNSFNSFLQGIFLGFKTLHIFWNFLFYPLTPYLCRRK